MKFMTLTAAGLLFSVDVPLVTVAMASADEALDANWQIGTSGSSDDPLLDARLEVTKLQLRFTDKSPRMIAAKARVDAISKWYSETAVEYRTHLRERIVLAETEESELRLHYTMKHPRMILLESELTFLRQELQQSGRTDV